MIKRLFVIILVFSLLGCGSEKNPVSPVEIQNHYRVKKVIDGDTIVLDNDEVVRYIGIDTPEIRHKVKNKWVYAPRPYAEEAKGFNRQLVEGKVVNLEFDVEKRDRYGRLLAYVYVGDIFVNAKMLQDGFALLFTHPPNIKYVELFIRLAKEARENKKGLWSKRP
jgi:micrococcal nuclease